MPGQEKCLIKDHIKHETNLESMQKHQSRNKDRHKTERMEEFILEENITQREKQKKISHIYFMLKTM